MRYHDARHQMHIQVHWYIIFRLQVMQFHTIPTWRGLKNSGLCDTDGIQRIAPNLKQMMLSNISRSSHHFVTHVIIRGMVYVHIVDNIHIYYIHIQIYIKCLCVRVRVCVWYNQEHSAIHCRTDVSRTSFKSIAFIRQVQRSTRNIYEGNFIWRTFTNPDNLAKK